MYGAHTGVACCMHSKLMQTFYTISEEYEIHDMKRFCKGFHNVQMHTLGIWHFVIYYLSS